MSTGKRCENSACIDPLELQILREKALLVALWEEYPHTAAESGQQGYRNKIAQQKRFIKQLEASRND